METTGRTERGDQILKCNISLLSEEFIIHIQTVPHTHAHTHIQKGRNKKGQKGRKEEHSARQKWENGDEE